MKYLSKEPFSVGGYGKEYSKNYTRIFRRKMKPYICQKWLFITRWYHLVLTLFPFGLYINGKQVLGNKFDWTEQPCPNPKCKHKGCISWRQGHI